MQFLKLIWKRKTVVIVSTVSVSLLGLVLSFIINPVYKATVEIAIQPTDAISGFPQDEKAVMEYLRHQAQIIKSNDVIDDVIDKLHLNISDVLDQKKPRQSFLKHIGVQILGKSIIKITATAKTPQLAAAMASQTATSFLEMHKEKSFAVSEGALEWLAEASKLSKDLKDAENKIMQFINDNDMQNPKQQLESYQEKADALLQEKAQLLADLEKSGEFLQQLEQLVKENTAAEIITQRLSMPLPGLLETYKSEYKSIQSEIERLLVTYKPDHPKIVELNKRKDAIIEEVDLKINDLLKESKNKTEYAKKRIQEIETQAEKEKSRYGELLDKKRDFDILNSKLENLTTLYEEAQQQLKSSGISIVSVSIVDFVREGTAPVSETKPIVIFLVIFTVAGLITGILMALFIERSAMKKAVPATTTVDIAQS